MTPAEDLRVQLQLLRDEVREVRALMENWHENHPGVQA